MAPKKGRKVVRTTTKVVKETVEVTSVVGSQEAQPEVTERREEEQTLITTKSIPIEDVEDEAQDQARPSSTTPPRKDAPQRQQEDDTARFETRPEIDDLTTPPIKEAPLRMEGKTGRAQTRTGKRAEAEESKKKAVSGQKRGKRRMRGGMGEGYKRYVFRVMKQVHPGMAITSGAMMVINNFMTDMFERLATEASKLSTYNKKQTMTAREIQGAVKLVLPGELGKHALAEGNKAINNYVTYDKKKTI